MGDGFIDSFFGGLAQGVQSAADQKIRRDEQKAREKLLKAQAEHQARQLEAIENLRGRQAPPAQMDPDTGRLDPSVISEAGRVGQTAGSQAPALNLQQGMRIASKEDRARADAIDLAVMGDAKAATAAITGATERDLKRIDILQQQADTGALAAKHAMKPNTMVEIAQDAITRLESKYGITFDPVDRAQAIREISTKPQRVSDLMALFAPEAAAKAIEKGKVTPGIDSIRNEISKLLGGKRKDDLSQVPAVEKAKAQEPPPELVKAHPPGDLKDGITAVDDTTGLVWVVKSGKWVLQEKPDERQRKFQLLKPGGQPGPGLTGP